MRSIWKAAIAALTIGSLLASSPIQAARNETPAPRPMSGDRVDFVLPVLGPFAYTISACAMRPIAGCAAQDAPLR